MSAVRILVADGNKRLRRRVCAVLASHAGWQICGEAADGREAVEKARDLRPDVVVLDIDLPPSNGLDATRRILLEHPRQRVLLLAITGSEQEVEAVLKAGARGFVLQSEATKQVTAAVEALHRNRIFFNSQLGKTVLTRLLTGNSVSTRQDRVSTLTAREREVVELLAAGQSTKEVAARLGVSVKTAETHRSNLMRKLGLHRLSELVLYVVRNTLVVEPDSSSSSKDCPSSGLEDGLAA
jgi:DNA-binding NarL/FixJ family response regulator